MTDKCSETLREWLRDVYAMEVCAAHLFSKYLDNFKDYPEIYIQLESAAQCCIENQTRLSIRMQQLGTNYSTVKNLGVEFFGELNNTAMIIEDQAVKTMSNLHSYTSLMISSYQILVVAAEAVKDKETELLCKSLYQQAACRAEWLSSLLNFFTKNFFIKIQ